MIRLGKTTLQYYSDFHIINKIPVIKQLSNNIALCGDIGNPFDKNYSDFFEQLSNNYDNVFIIAGNHEYWQHKYRMQDVDDKINDIVCKFSNINFLNKSSAKLDDHTVAGCTLWTKRNMMSFDNKKIINNNNKLISINDVNNLHNDHVKFIKDTISTCDKLIVLTHHLPTYRLVSTKYRKEPYIYYQSLCSSDLDHLIKLPIDAWLCGHSHCVKNIMIGDVYCGINSYKH